MAEVHAGVPFVMFEQRTEEEQIEAMLLEVIGGYWRLLLKKRVRRFRLTTMLKTTHLRNWLSLLTQQSSGRHKASIQLMNIQWKVSSQWPSRRCFHSGGPTSVTNLIAPRRLTQLRISTLCFDVKMVDLEVIQGTTILASSHGF
jgi:hypothetical protein